MLKIYNTLTGKKEPFEPLVPKTVRMYVCGVTVYDYCHIGHARSALVFDVIRRYLEYSGYRVEFAKNFTDVDDKIIKRANEQGVNCDTITAKFIQAYYDDMEKLGVRPASIEPKATEHMADIIQLTERLIAKGLAYQVDGDVYFEVAKYPDYGRLSKRRLDDLQAGARVEVDERKRAPMDFALWKSSKPGEPAWDSPWGPGRPGWHIECSAMSIRHLGETFDIHGGGMDLIFPHHENEIAQSCGATGKEFARYWIHNGFVQINQEKMSKSLGNFFTIREIFEKCATFGWKDHVTAEVLRYFLLSTHYKSPLDFSDKGLYESKNALDNVYGLLQRLEELVDTTGAGDEQLQEAVKRTSQSFTDAMNDDFNVPAALAQLHNLRHDVNRLLITGLSKGAGEQVRRVFKTLGNILGLYQLSPLDWQHTTLVSATATIPIEALGSVTASTAISIVSTMSQEDIETLNAQIAERNEARRQKNFKKADEMRTFLEKKYSIIIEDKPDGTSRWKR